MEGLQYLVTDGAPLSDRVDEIIEGLIVAGDLLDLADVTIDDSAAKLDFGQKLGGHRLRGMRNMGSFSTIS